MNLCLNFAAFPMALPLLWREWSGWMDGWMAEEDDVVGGGGRE